MRFKTTDGVEISYEIIGEGEPVIFIHGWAATKNWWKFILPLDNFKAVIFDIRGHGESSIGKDYSPKRIVLDVLELLNHLGISDYNLVGHSLGGVIASLVAKEKRPKKLILIATPPLIKYSRFQIAFLSFMLKRAVSIMRKTFTPKTLYKPRKELLEFIWKESAKGNPDAYIEIMKQFNGINVIEILKEVDSEKIAIVPMQDKLISPEAQIESFRKICKILKIEEAGHNVMLEKPKIVQKYLIEALKD